MGRGKDVHWESWRSLDVRTSRETNAYVHLLLQHTAFTDRLGRRLTSIATAQRMAEEIKTVTHRDAGERGRTT